MEKEKQASGRLTEKQQEMLRELPGVDTVLSLADGHEELGRLPLPLRTAAVRRAVATLRQAILDYPDLPDSTGPDDEPKAERVLRQAATEAEKMLQPNLKPVINASGVVVHTNLGRSPLSETAMKHLVRVAGGYSNLEFDLDLGRRGIRYACVEELLCELTGAEAAMAVNNNAGAVLLALESTARGKEVIVSRGELIEIGGSFRIPEVMEKSGCRLVEVGTTNRTHPADYERAINEETALLLKVHTSNYGLVGFTAEVDLQRLTEIGRERCLPVMNDLGSGTLIDFADYGLTHEPTINAAVAAGTDIVTFSGDKLLGGPQAGIIVGKKKIIDLLKKNPLTRALRIDKLTLAALEMTLREYRDKAGAVKAIPTLKMITMPKEEVVRKADILADMLRDISDSRLSVSVDESFSKAGGGSLPFLKIPTACVAVRIEGLAVEGLEKMLRRSSPPVIGRIEKDRFLMDPRTVADSEISVIRDIFTVVLDSVSI